LKTLQKYLTGQVLATMLMTVAVFAFVILLVGGLKDILPLLLSGHVSLVLILKAFGLLIPFACVYALPMGFITATLLVFGRFSADQELTAARASGISLLSLVTPILLLSLLCCGISACFNLELGPRSHVEFVQLRNALISNAATAELPEGRFIRDFPGYVFYIGKNNNGELENVLIYQLENETNANTVWRAAHGRLSSNRAANQLTMYLFDAHLLNINAHGNSIGTFENTSIDFNLNTSTNHAFKPKISDLTFPQLQNELRELENLNSTFTATNATELRTQMQLLRQQQKDFAEPVRVEMHRQIAFSFACFGFTLIGIPLGIRVHRRETNISIAIALILVMIYYGFIMLGESLAARPEFYPHLILWIPNFIFQTVGAVMLWRANRGI
jgi:lipopolysaccharide export system permease protein